MSRLSSRACTALDSLTQDPTNMESRSRGFTLIEVLLVVVVIGIAASVVVLSIGGDDQESRLRDEAEMVLVDFEFASEESWNSSESMGLFITPGSFDEPWSYYWRRFRDQQWMETDFPDRKFEVGTELSMIMDNQLIDLRKLAAEKVLTPAMVFYAGGEALRMELLLRNGEYQEEIQVDQLGRVKLLDKDNES